MRLSQIYSIQEEIPQTIDLSIVVLDLDRLRIDMECYNQIHLYNL